MYVMNQGRKIQMSLNEVNINNIILYSNFSELIYNISFVIVDRKAVFKNLASPKEVSTA